MKPSGVKVGEREIAGMPSREFEKQAVVVPLAELEDEDKNVCKGQRRVWF